MVNPLKIAIATPLAKKHIISSDITNFQQVL